MENSIFARKQDRNNSVCKTFLFALLFFLTLTIPIGAITSSYLWAISIAPAFAMSSSTYKIPTDSINFGGQQSSSASFKELDTMGELGSGLSSSSNYKLSAGFLTATNVYLAITSPSDVTLSPSISGVAGGTGDGSAVWTVTTDNAAGYSMTISASTDPAMQSGANSFANYTPGGNPDYNWGISSSDSEFGFTPEGADIYSRFKDNGSSCNISSGDTADKCWDSITTTPKTIAQRATGNHPSGTATTVKFRAESGTSHIQVNGAYTATVTLTAISL